MRVLILAAVVLAACFDPDEREGTLRCSVATGCPSGFVCRADLVCWRLGSEEQGDASVLVDAGAGDAAVPACSNGLDDDCDGKTDEEDPGCQSATDNDERGVKRCDDGMDNDHDGFVDYRTCGTPPADPGCDKGDDDSE